LQAEHSKRETKRAAKERKKKGDELHQTPTRSQVRKRKIQS